MFEEKFVRETIRNFPHKQCPLLQQLVRLIAPITLVSVSIDLRTTWRKTLLLLSSNRIIIRFVCRVNIRLR